MISYLPQRFTLGVTLKYLRFSFTRMAFSTSLPVRSQASGMTCLAERLPCRSAPLRTVCLRRQLRRGTHITQAASDSVPDDYGLDSAALQGFKVLVAGATGRVGRRIVEVLVEQNVPVRALVRDTAKARAMLPGINSGLVEVVQGDVFQYATLPKALGDANAIICSTGASEIADPFSPFNVDYQGTANLVALARQRALRKFVLVSSIGADDVFNPLNLFWGVLFWKKRAEEELQRSGLDYTIVRPGGLKDSQVATDEPTSVVMKGPGYYGVPPKGKAGAINRREVAEVCVASLYVEGAAKKVVEIIEEKNAPKLTFGQMFDAV